MFVLKITILFTLHKFSILGMEYMRHPVYKVMCYAFKSMFYELFDGTIHGLSNIPTDGPFLLACNHASYFDPPFLGALIEQREIFAFAKKSLFNSPIKKWIFTHLNSIPVDRNSGDIAAIKAVFNLLKNNKGVMIFPEGTRTSDGNFGEAHAGIGLFAYKSKVPVVPCRIFGTYEIMNRFSCCPNWNKRAIIVINKPLYFQEYDCPESHNRYLDIAKKIMQSIISIQQPQINIL